MESLVIIAIVALLTAIIAPSLLGAISRAKAVKCGSNLRRIAEAVANLRATSPNTELLAETWQGTLRPYLDDNGDIYVCPAFAGDETGLTGLTELVYFRIENGSTTWQVELDENAYVVKLSNAQYNQARNEGWFGNSRASDNFPRNQWPYADDGTGVYWLCMDEPGGDNDFKDIMTRVTNNRNGTTTLAMITGYTEHTNTLRSKADDSQIKKIFSNTTAPITVDLPTGTFKRSYGMNFNVQDILSDGSKALVIDYDWIVAKTTHDWSADESSPGVPTFARHMGKMNVLFVGEEVRLLRPEDVNPADQSNQNALWNR